MGLFKQKLDFDKFSYFAITQIFSVYEADKEGILDKAQWENKSKLTKAEREKLWNDFLVFIPVGLCVYAFKFFNFKYENGDIAARVTEACFHYLYKDKEYTEKEVALFGNKMIDLMDEIEQFIERQINMEKEMPGSNKMDDLVAMAGVVFTNHYCKDDRTYEQIKNNVYTKSSDKMFTALKLSKSYLVKGGILGSLFSSFNIVW